jgi:hypothetical protein
VERKKDEETKEVHGGYWGMFKKFQEDSRRLGRGKHIWHIATILTCKTSSICGLKK